MTDIQIQRGRSGSSSSTMPEEEADMGETEDGFLEVDLGDGYLPPRSPRVCVRSTAPYLADQGFERYQYALRNLIPVRRKPSKKTDIGVDHSGLISFVMSTWFSKLMYKAHRKGLLIEDIPQGSPLDSCDHNVQRLEVLWQEELRNHGPSDASLSRAVWRFVRTRVIADWILYTVSCVLGFLTPMVFMRKLLEFAQDPDATLQTGFIYAFLLMICEIFRIFFFSWRSVMSFRTAVRLRVACLGLLYKKIVRLNNFEEKFIGQLINIFANDSERVFDVVVFGPMLISGPMVLVAGVGYVLSILSPWALSGIFVIVAFYPIQYFISRVSALMRAKTIRVTDQRVGLMNEILMHIKTIKVNAWEECFADKIFSIRAREQRLIEKRSYLASLGSSLAPTIPIIAAIVSFLSHIGAGNTLTAAQAFPFITVMIAQTRNSMNITQIAVANVTEAIIGFKKRIQKFLLVEEIQSSVQRPIDRGQAVSIGGGTFAWSPVWNPGVRISSKKKEKKKLESPSKKSDNEEAEKLTCGTTENVGLRPVLQAINFCAPKGYLVGVCGPIGAGKTSLLLSILGQMRLVNGQLARSGSCAFVSQHAWITNGTVRDNILFGETFVSARYYSVINSCALNEDFNQFPGGDLTEIGERGVNLSGGQRQRVALARALYANKDIYLLDDPLSAVDVTVGAAVFENYIQRQLRNKTVILVTHQIQYLSQCDEVYLMKDGRIVERGSHEELLNVNYEYASMVRQSQGNPAESSGLEEKVLSNKYISAAGGYLMASLVFVVFFSHAASSAFSSWWLATWIKAGGGNTTIKVNNATVASANLADNPDFKYYQNVYVSTIGLILFCIALRCFVVTKATIRASAVIHTELFHKVVNSRMLFFETNPIGRMQNVFTRDMDEVDTRLPLSVENVIGNFWIVAFAVMFICIVFPWFFVAFIPIAIIYSFLSIIFRKGIRDLKRLENTTRSPVFSNLVETVNGLNTIRAFNKEGEYIQRFFQLIDENSTCSYLWNVGMRWLAVRIDLLAAITISTTAVLVVALHGYVAPALAGLALSYSWHISGVLQYTTRLVSETEVRFISVERILAYIETALKEGKQSTSKPPASWPSEGRISFQNVSMSYRQNLPNVLNNVSFNFLPGEKVGIVGRTGSGKTSLTVALFRLVELSNGSIKLDGMDIAGIPLSVLRSNITIVPQDPVLFSGSIRSNLDPKNKSSDPEIWEALRKSRLAERISTFPLKLETVVSSGSSGLSVGECQLLCLTRALLKKSKILILDEATASIDPETEAVTQLTLQEEFKTCTVLTIAHRLLTVKNCDRILVMDEGKVIEFEETEKLLADSNSVFARMVASMEST